MNNTAFYHQKGEQEFKRIGGDPGTNERITEQFKRANLPAWALRSFLHGYNMAWSKNQMKGG